jgi:hypothetical protein
MMNITKFIFLQKQFIENCYKKNLCSKHIVLNSIEINNKLIQFITIATILYFLHIILHQTQQIASMSFMFQNKKIHIKIKIKKGSKLYIPNSFSMWVQAKYFVHTCYLVFYLKTRKKQPSSNISKQIKHLVFFTSIFNLPLAS